MIKTVKKSNSRYIMFSLSSGISVISLFLLSQILISMDPLKKSILRQMPKKIFSLFSFNLFMYQNSSFSHQSRQKSVEKTYLRGKNSESLVYHLWQYVLLLHFTTCNMYWDCITCFSFHSSTSIKIIASRMFSGGEKYSATTAQLSMTLSDYTSASISPAAAKKQEVFIDS